MSDTTFTLDSLAAALKAEPKGATKANPARDSIMLTVRKVAKGAPQYIAGVASTKGDTKGQLKSGATVAQDVKRYCESQGFSLDNIIVHASKLTVTEFTQPQVFLYHKDDKAQVVKAIAAAS